MTEHLVSLLVCPYCQSGLVLFRQEQRNDRVLEGTLTCQPCAKEFPITGGVPRFVGAEGYAESFGFQWNKFGHTQLDSHSGVPISRERFYSQSGWSPGKMAGRLVLEVGCGAGRFTEVALTDGARVVAVDYSSAVDACFRNHGDKLSFDVLQASLYELPLKRELFDMVFCFGVLQHTPDVKAAFMALPPFVRPGGALAVDVYERSLRYRFHPKYVLRPLTRRLPADVLFAWVERWVPRLLPLSRALGCVPRIGRRLRYLVPVANYQGILPLSPEHLVQWSILDTFDWLSPRYDQPQTAGTLRRWFEEAGLVDIEVLKPHHLTGRGKKPTVAPLRS